MGCGPPDPSVQGILQVRIFNSLLKPVETLSGFPVGGGGGVVGRWELGVGGQEKLIL